VSVLVWGTYVVFVWVVGLVFVWPVQEFEWVPGVFEWVAPPWFWWVRGTFWWVPDAFEWTVMLLLWVFHLVIQPLLKAWGWGAEISASSTCSKRPVGCSELPTSPARGTPVRPSWRKAVRAARPKVNKPDTARAWAGRTKAVSNPRTSDREA
jgi:hypothetical protein